RAVGGHVCSAAVLGHQVVTGGGAKGQGGQWAGIQREQRGDIAAGEFTGLGRAKAGVHDRAPDGRGGRRARDEDRADAGVALAAAGTATDAAIVVVRVAESDRAAELVGADGLGRTGGLSTEIAGEG